LLDAVAKTDVLLMEAFMYRCHPQTDKLVELIRDGAIGEVRLIQATFSYDLGASDSAYANIRRRNDVAGGGIMDVGCYTTSMARLIAGAALGLSAPAEPEQVTGVAHIGERGRVDEWAAASLLFAGDIVADLFCGTAIRVQSKVRVWGTEGNLVVPSPWKPIQGQIVLSRGGSEPEAIEVPAPADCYALEADVIARNIGRQQAPYPCMTWQDSLGNMKTLDAWRAAVGLVFDAEK
jgi:predicted dehydrogenase